MSEVLKEKDQIRIISIFAHPDDAEVKMGGTAARFAEMGHAVKFLSLTNGDAGHHTEGGGQLAKRRKAEALEAARRLGIDEYSILNVHDGELEPGLHLRHRIIREIRSWNADLVIGLRPNDYHPDHRYAGTLVMDAAYLVVVPNVVPDVPPLSGNPVFLYMQDEFRKPYPFSPDIVVDIEGTYEKKIDSLDAHQSQFYEWLPWVSGDLADVPEKGEQRRIWLEKWFQKFAAGHMSRSEDVVKSLKAWYGDEKTDRIKKVEAFEIAEYGRRPERKEILRLFPMLQK